jgi:hypothetical protein
MRKWILASQAEKVGRLYWSTQRGWTYKELASLYKEQTRETYEAVLDKDIMADPIWFECEVDFRGAIKVLDEPKQERPHFPGGKDLLNAIGDLTCHTAVIAPLNGGQAPDMVQMHRGYNVNVYRKRATF